MTNCPNCGGVIRLDADKCPFCGTPYYDISCIPLNKPFVLRFKIGEKTIVQKVYTEGVEVTNHPFYSVGRDIFGETLLTEAALHTEYIFKFASLPTPL